ncbi:unnamed protein product [Ostreobium quekettii]|uniref:serine O-acetyltransferase n=1 Tax=Ostreobium quekettii TaxID=121088 RepID=A0A8S1ISY3_9CHLO|nr:unnamed protein product [Ostreobium quekettii]
MAGTAVSANLSTAQCSHAPVPRDAAAGPWRTLRRGQAAPGGRGVGLVRATGESSNGALNGTGGAPQDATFVPVGDNVWNEGAFPSYMQSGDESRFCSDWQEALSAAEGEGPKRKRGTAIWEKMMLEAERDAKSEPLLSSFLYASILAHDSFERALAFVLANRLANATLLPTQLFEIFSEVLTQDQGTLESALSDISAVVERDPACSSFSSALLYFKGFQALQVHRIAHALWHRGQKVIALTLQSRVSEVYAMDIHPAATIGRGLLIDHGTGVVIGETAVVGNNVSILQNVTLGGTGKEVGDRHPKIHDNVLIGASATVLGNITIGKGAQVAAGSLVLKPVPPHTMVAGSPAKEVGKVSGNPALKMDQWSKKFDPFCDMFGQPVKEQQQEQEASSDGVALAMKEAAKDIVVVSEELQEMPQEPVKEQQQEQEASSNGVAVALKEATKDIVVISEEPQEMPQENLIEVSKSDGRQDLVEAALGEEGPVMAEPEYFI